MTPNDKHTDQPIQESPTPGSPKKKWLGEFGIAIVAHWSTPGLLAIGSAVWLYFEKDPGIPLWVLAFVLFIIFVAYFALTSHYIFPNLNADGHQPKFNLKLLALVALMVTAPLAIMQSFTKARTSELLAQKQKLETELESARQAQRTVDSKRIQIFAQVTDSMMKILQKPELDSADLRDLLNFCIESISLNKPAVHDLRAAVFYLEKTGNYIVVPDNGYYGYALDQDIRGLNFQISPQTDAENDEVYRERLGVAGWSFVKKRPVRDPDVQTIKPGVEWRYKRFPASQKDQADRAMICIGIPDVRAPKEGRYVGILSISSLTPDVFTDNDLAIARFFSTLLARFRTPVETPSSLLKVKSQRSS